MPNHSHGAGSLESLAPTRSSGDSCICSACGGLQCLCRPRFFPGQLLTDEDLNRLESYFVEKNKLHNRYLHGYGVVCGLEVTCHPCDLKSVIVKPGYALSPCGNDIVVCQDSSVNICELLNQCRPVSQPECDPAQPGPVDLCPDGESEWIVAICYDEKLSRGQTALRADVGTACCAKCAGSGASSCGCGGSQSQNGNGSLSKVSCGSQNNKKPVTCEPTLICETYKVVVYKKRPAEDRVGELNEKLVRTFKLFRDEMPVSPGKEATLRDRYQYAKAVRDGILNFASRLDCSNVKALKDDYEKKVLEQYEAYANQPEKYKTYIAGYVGSLAQSAAPLFRQVLCKALMPVCSPSVQRDCVPLAQITVSRKNGECRVTSICNGAARELVLTAPLIESWGAPVWQNMKGFLDELCCPTREVVRPPVTDIRTNYRPAFAEAAMTDADRAGLSRRILAKSFAQPARAVKADTLALGLLGALDEEGKAVLSEEELHQSVSLIMFSQVLRPALQDLLPVSWMKAIEAVSETEESKRPGLLTPPVSMGGIESDMKSLKTTVAGQAKLIAELKKKLDRLSPGNDR